MIRSTHIYLTLYIYIYIGWWFQPSQKYYMASWDDEIPNIWNNKKMQTTNQYIYIYTPVVQHKAVAEVSKIRNL